MQHDIIYIPEDWDYDLFINAYENLGYKLPKNIGAKIALFERASILLSSIYQFSYCAYKQTEAFPEITLYSRYLKQIGNDKYKKYLELFIAEDIIKTPKASHYDSEKGECKTYQLSDTLSPILVPYTLSNFRARKKTKALYATKVKTKRKKSKKLLKAYPFLNPLRNGDLIINVAAAKECLQNELIPSKQDKISKSKIAKNYYENILPQKIDSFNEQIKTNMNPDNYGGRIYTEAVKLPGKLRKHLRLDGEPLISLDIKCSHFYHLAAALLILKKKSFSDHPTPLTSSTHTPEHLPFMFPKTPERLAALEIELHKIIELATTPKVINGKPDLYEYFGQHQAKKLDRDCSKKILNTILNDKLESNKKYIVGYCKAFRKLFPETFEIIRAAKKSNYKALGKYITSVERYMLLDLVANELYNTHGISTVSVHDCLMCKECDIDTVNAVAIETYQSLLEQAPLFDIK
jgi:hypothetical protein